MFLKYQGLYLPRKILLKVRQSILQKLHNYMQIVNDTAANLGYDKTIHFYSYCVDYCAVFLSKFIEICPYSKIAAPIVVVCERDS